MVKKNTKTISWIVKPLDSKTYYHLDSGIWEYK